MNTSSVFVRIFHPYAHGSPIALFFWHTRNGSPRARNNTDFGNANIRRNVTLGKNVRDTHTRKNTCGVFLRGGGSKAYGKVRRVETYETHDCITTTTTTNGSCTREVCRTVATGENVKTIKTSCSSCFTENRRRKRERPSVQKSKNKNRYRYIYNTSRCYLFV